ncbi:MAG TPA: M55 family metallopeptidase [Prolixibacteraceae bacterium]|nr:M55 family metallopeptidase [Prolixibacteraceae bacterium]HPT30793.1 M55 family metallopeptidase [Prolixibacteraceae bacterium]
MNQPIKFRFLAAFFIFLFPDIAPAGAQTVNPAGFSVYIFTDMEGCSGLTNRDQILTEEGPLRMAEDMNACIAACFEAGATKVVVRDGHGGGKNVDPTLIDKRAQLVQGSTPGVRYKGLEGCEALILLGYHAKAQTPAAIMAHSYSSATIQSMYLNGKAVGEIGVDAAIAAEHKVPVVLVSGDDKACAEATEWIPLVVTCQVKTATSASSGSCLPLEEAHALIAAKTKEALSNRKSIPLIHVNYPATMRWEYIPQGSPRVYAPDFKPFPDPKTKELTSASVEKILVGDY